MFVIESESVGCYLGVRVIGLFFFFLYERATAGIYKGWVVGGVRCLKETGGWPLGGGGLPTEGWGGGGARGGLGGP